MITKQLFPLKGGGYGYHILINGKGVIKQTEAPAISGLHVMTEKQASTLADMVIEKLRANISELPFLTMEAVNEVIKG